MLLARPLLLELRHSGSRRSQPSTASRLPLSTAAKGSAPQTSRFSSLAYAVLLLQKHHDRVHTPAL